jgi:hypothetical protein
MIPHPLHRSRRWFRRSAVVRCCLAQAAFAVVLATPGQAGPCMAAIERFQAHLDARLDAIAGAGGSGRESVSALLHHEATPESIARAEQEIGDGPGPVRAVVAIARARVADGNGDTVACVRALADARRAIGR